MSDIDKRLQQIVMNHTNNSRGDLAAALLRARKALLLAESRLFDNAIKPVISKALADTELEESLL